MGLGPGGPTGVLSPWPEQHLLTAVGVSPCPQPVAMAYHSFLLEPISCHAWNKDRTRKYGRGTPSQNPQG